MIFSNIFFLFFFHSLTVNIIDSGIKNKLILFSTHQVDILPKVCHAVLLIDKNRLQLIEEPGSFKSTIYESFGINNLESDEV